jgi:hypothetical protein
MNLPIPIRLDPLLKHSDQPDDIRLIAFEIDERLGGHPLKILKSDQ